MKPVLDVSSSRKPVPGSVAFAEKQFASVDAASGEIASTGMIREQGEVVALVPGGVLVETQRASGCASCSSQKGCGVRVLQGVFGGHRHRVTARTSLPLQIGDRVELVLPAAALVQAALLMYLLPLVALVTGAVIGQTVFHMNGAAILGGASGFVLSLVLVARLQSATRRQGRFAPQVEQVLFQAAD